jgi:hypothetical protein
MRPAGAFSACPVAALAVARSLLFVLGDTREEVSLKRIMRPTEPELPQPDVDERLVMPETRYEIEDGRVVYVPPADEPHGALHARVAAVLAAHRAPAYAVAADMLTRTSRIDDIAPDVSVYPAARDPRTGGRQLEELAFEIASTETLGHAGKRATKLTSRGVRRVFAIDVGRVRVLEWSATLAAWSMLEHTGAIADPALAVPVPVAALVDASHADSAVAQAYRAQRHPEFIAEHEEGRAEGIAHAVLAVLQARGLAPTDAERQHILATRDIAQLDRWLAAAVTCSTVGALLDE